MIIDEETYLEHFGIKGMRWGIRRDLRRQRNSQKFLNKANEIQNEIDRIKSKNTRIKGINPVSTFRRSRNNVKLIDLREQKAKAIDNAERKAKGKLSSGQKKLLIGSAVVGVALGAYGAYTMTQSGETRRLLTKGSDFVKSKFSDPLDPGWKLDRGLADPKMNTEDIMSKVVSHINPGYGDPGTKVNCRRATFAYEMRRRGYDVAATKTTDGRGQTLVGMYNALSKERDIVPQNRSNIVAKIISEARKGPDAEKPFGDFITSTDPFGEKVISPGEIFKELATQPDRARGELGMRWFGGGGHSMAWEIVDGKPIIFDTQTGRIFKSAREFDETAGAMVQSAFTRLDNKPLNTNFLMRWVKNVD